MATMMYPTLTKSQSMRSKRKSAVELLAESKPFYVKSEIVRDTTQSIPTRLSSSGTGYGGYNRSKSVNVAGHGTNYRPTTLPQCIAMLFSAGTFLYVATVHVLAELTQNPHHSYSKVQNLESGKTQTSQSLKTSELIYLVVGCLTPLLLTIGHHH